MTFSLVARDASGAFGAAICSSSPAVAARCVHLADGIGGVASQNITDPRLGALALDRLRDGMSAPETVAALTTSTRDVEYRQLLVVDAHGQAAAYSGPRALGVFADAVDDDVAAGGNMLATDEIPQAMIAAFAATSGDLEWRLFAALRAATDAGGEAGPVHSAGLSVVRGVGWRVTDLRVDWTDVDPVEELGALLTRWLPQRDDYVTRALAPAAAPSYGVPGDE